MDRQLDKCVVVVARLGQHPDVGDVVLLVQGAHDAVLLGDRVAEQFGGGLRSRLARRLGSRSTVGAVRTPEPQNSSDHERNQCHRRRPEERPMSRRGVGGGTSDSGGPRGPGRILRWGLEIRSCFVQCRSECLAGPVPLCGIHRGGLSEHRTQPSRYAEPRRVRRTDAADLVDQRRQPRIGHVAEGLGAGGQGEQGESQRIDVRLLGRRRTLEHLGRGVHHGHCQRVAGGDRTGDGGGAEVGEQGQARPVEQDVRRLDVTMQHA